MSKESNGSGGGIGLMGVLFVVFLVLKLCGVIDWSWWLVTLPLWGPIALVLAIMAVLFVFVGLVKAVVWVIEKK